MSGVFLSFPHNLCYSRSIGLAFLLLQISNLSVFKLRKSMYAIKQEGGRRSSAIYSCVYLIEACFL